MATTNQQSKKITMNKPKMSLNKMLVLCLPQFLVMTFSIILSQVLVISISLRIRDLFDAAVAGDSAFLLAGAPAFIGVVLAILPLNIWLAFTKAKFMKKAGTVTRQRYLRRAFDKNINEFQKSGISRYINDITNNINTLEERYFQQIITVVTSLITFCGSLYLIVRVNWQSMFFVVILLAILLFTMLRSGNLLKKPEKQKAGYLEEYTRFAKESLSAFRIVKSFQLEKRIIRDFDQRSQNVQDKGYDIEKRATYLQAANQLITTAAALFGLLTGIRAAASGSISIGVLFVLILAISNLIDPIFVMSEALPHIRSVGPIFEKMEDHLENQQVQEIEKPYPGLKDQISFVGISFNYPDIPVLKNSYVQFQKGGKYLIIGPSGSGKSTILKLLRKYFEPDQGEILIDASPLNEIEADSYYQKLANIEQDIFIFDDTIRNNITMYQDVSEERLEAAISAAGLNNLLSSRDNGLDELLVNNGSSLSGGEKARIAIARGLLSEAEIMLLDEPFASLDDQTAQKIEHNLINLPEVTVLNVSHVIFDQTRDLYDDICLVKDGQIFSKSDKIT